MEDMEYTAVENPSGDCGAHATPSFIRTKQQTQSPQMVSIQGYRNVEPNKVKAMMDALVNIGPLVASIAGEELQSYSFGVIDSCDDYVIDHAVVMVGYGIERKIPSSQEWDGVENAMLVQHKGMKYWKVRNSWGPTWGESGHFRLQREAVGEEVCNWDMDPAKGIACKDKKGPEGKYPAKQWFCGSCGILSDTSYPVGVHVPEALLQERY